MACVISFVCCAGGESNQLPTSTHTEGYRIYTTTVGTTSSQVDRYFVRRIVVCLLLFVDLVVPAVVV